MIHQKFLPLEFTSLTPIVQYGPFSALLSLPPLAPLASEPSEPFEPSVTLSMTPDGPWMTYGVRVERSEM